MLKRESRPDGRTKLTFILPDEDPPGQVSVVGNFNDWDPWAHPFVTDGDGSREVSVLVEPGVVHFRYLATGDAWRDDPEADRIDEHGSFVEIPVAPESPPIRAGEAVANWILRVGRSLRAALRPRTNA